MELVVPRVPHLPSLGLAWEADEWAPAARLRLGHARPDSSDHRPRVEVQAMTDAAALALRYRVEDRYVLCRRTEPQSDVCRDACVEFFFCPAADKRYINIEVNAIGTALASYHPTSGENKPIDPARLSISPSLRGPIQEEIQEPVLWTLAFSIPYALVEQYAGTAAPGKGSTWRCNFYKIASDSSHPHWLSWSPLPEGVTSFHDHSSYGLIRFG